MSIQFNDIIEEEIYDYNTKFTQICYSESLVAVSGIDNILRVYNIKSKEKSFRRWKCSYKITCIAAAGSQLAVATSNGRVFVLQYISENPVFKIEEKTTIFLPKSRSINQIRLRVKEEDTLNTECIMCMTSQVYSCKWMLNTIKAEITEDSRNESPTSPVPGGFFQQLPGSGTLHLIAETEKGYFFVDGIRVTDDKIMLVRIGINRDLLLVTFVPEHAKPFIHEYKMKNSELYVIDITEDGCILLQDRFKNKTILINGNDSRKIIFQSEAEHSYTSGCFLLTSEKWVYYVLLSEDPSIMTLHVRRADRDLPSRCLQTWNIKKSKIFGSSIAAHDNNIAAIWNDKSNKHSAIIRSIVKTDQEDELLSVKDISNYYKPTWLKPIRNRDEIIDSAFLTLVSCGALLIKEDDTFQVLVWIYQSHHFQAFRFSLKHDETNESYSTIAMRENLITVCSSTRHKYVTIQIWKLEDDGLFKRLRIFQLPSNDDRPNKLISLDSGRFCLATGNKLFVFDENPKITSCTLDSHALNIRYDFAFRTIKACCVYKNNYYIETYDTVNTLRNIGDRRALYEPHINEENICEPVLDPNGTSSMSSYLSSYWGLKFCPYGRLPIYLDSKAQIFQDDCNLLEDGELLVRIKPDYDKICSYSLDDSKSSGTDSLKPRDFSKRYSLNDSKPLGTDPLKPRDFPKPNWSLNWDRGSYLEWTVHRSGNRLFLVTKDSLSVIREGQEGNKAEQILFAYRL